MRAMKLLRDQWIKLGWIWTYIGEDRQYVTWTHSSPQYPQDSISEGILWYTACTQGWIHTILHFESVGRQWGEREAW